MPGKEITAKLKQTYTVVREWYNISSAVGKKKFPFETGGNFFPVQWSLKVMAFLLLMLLFWNKKILL